MDKDQSLGNKVIDFIYDNINSNNYDFLIGKFNDFIYVEFIINFIIKLMIRFINKINLVINN